jgi:hypothetical protein
MKENAMRIAFIVATVVVTGLAPLAGLMMIAGYGTYELCRYHGH